MWVHAASLGEVKLASKLVQEISRFSRVMLSSLTDTGLAAGEKLVGDRCFRFSDNPALVQSLLSGCKALVLVEGELWPNLLVLASEHQVPVFLVNARVGQATLRWLRFPGLLDLMLSGITTVYPKDPFQEPYLEKLGIPRAKIRFVGGLKFDGLVMEKTTEKTADKRELVVFGSLRSKEFAPVLECLDALREQAVVLAPRHLNKLNQLIRALRRRGIDFGLRTQGTEPTRGKVLVLDTFGELGRFYQRALVAFVGGTLVPGYGGHNVIEPVAMGAAVVFGPYNQNHAFEAKGLVEAKAGLVVKNGKELGQTLAKLLGEPDLREDMVRQGQSFIKANSGASQAIARDLFEVVSKGRRALE